MDADSDADADEAEQVPEIVPGVGTPLVPVGAAVPYTTTFAVLPAAAGAGGPALPHVLCDPSAEEEAAARASVTVRGSVFPWM